MQNRPVLVGTLILFMLFVSSRIFAQGTGAMGTVNIEQLQKQFALTKHDTDRVKLNYWVGKAENVTRIEYWDSLLILASKELMDLYTCRILLEKSTIYNASGKMPEAINWANRALVISETHGYSFETIELIKNLEKIYARQLDRQKSLEMSYKGLTFAEKINDKKAITDFKSSIARYYWSMGEMDKALPLHLKCLELAKEIDYQFGISSALVDIGSDYIAMNEDEKAVPYYLECKNYTGAVKGTIYEAYIYNSVGAAFQILKQYDSAYFYTAKGYKIAVALDNKQGICSLLASLAGISNLKGDYQGAKEQTLLALDLANTSGFTAQRLELLKILKEIYINGGNFQEALVVYEGYILLRDSVSSEKAQKEALKKSFEYALEKKQNENLLLSQRNAIQKLEINQGNYFLFGADCLILGVLVILFLIKRQNKYRSEYLQLQFEQRMLRSQMNPHFIFNSLNSIQQFVMTGKNREAEVYLSKFAKLIRNLLERSTEDNLTIREEFELLNGYLEMESLRFDDSIVYSLTGIENDAFMDCRIPQLIVQPIIENAIWHGLLPKENDRKVTIVFSYESTKTIRCVVDDNGIGRNEASKIVQMHKSRSLATNFIQQRLKAMRSTYKVDCRMEIIDKEDENLKSLGTQVILILPILK
jgi:Histidine kinase/Tetratricopeptide repeat